MKKNHSKTIIFLIIFSLITTGVLYPSTSYAVLGVPISTNLDYQSVMNFQKNFNFDKIATMVAKQILHQLTASVVNWINSGFEGSPLFLTNPGAFFLDVADQVTGAFLATNGPLSSLCSPFAIDIRLGLALSQTSMATQRYTCTLGKIIEAQRNGPDIIVNGQVINSSQSSMNGFLGGDFNQGGWPAFIALTTEPQNNPYGAFLSAQRELDIRINSRQAAIRADLQLGKGFMSWSKCKELPAGTNPGIVKDDPSMKIVNNGDGTVTYQRCEVQTPGSVISGTLEKNLNVPVTELELADDINAVVNALVTQMINKMLTSGLGSLSGNSGGGTSYTQQIINDSYSSQETQQTLDGLQTTVSSSIEQLDNALSLYTKSINLLTETKNNLLAAKACFNSKPNPSYFASSISEIDLIISYDIQTRLDELNKKQASGKLEKEKLIEISMSLAGTGSQTGVQAQLDKYNSLSQSGGLYVYQRYDDAYNTFSTIEKLMKTDNEKAAQFQRSCNSAGFY